MLARARIDGRTLLQCGAIVGATALLRLPFLGTIGPDEGGYAYVASQWARGGELYRSLWIDRPQGLLLAYRALLGVAATPWAVRLGATLAAAAVALLLVATGSLLGSRRAGVLAGVVYTFVSVGPRIEGYTFNGELAAAVPAAAAVAAALIASRRRSLLWFAAAGALGACGMLMKQSGFDGLAVALVVAALARSSRGRFASLAAAAAGAAAPLAASAGAGIADGWQAYWSALVASHLGDASAAVRLHRLGASAPAAIRDLLPLAVVAAFGAAQLRYGRTAPRIALVWVGAAAAGVNVGGLYWPHYYVQLLPPLALLAGLGLASLTPRRAWLAVAAMAFPIAFYVGNVVASPDRQSDRLVKYAAGFENDRRLADYVRSHTSPRQLVYAFQSRADFYFLADRRAASPYLWEHPLHDVPGARAALERTLAAQRARLVVVFQQPPDDRFGIRIRRILARDYRPVWRAPGTGTAVLAPARRARTTA